MDTLVGYVSFVFDEDTIKLRVTQQDRENRYEYDSEEKVKLSNSGLGSNSQVLRSITDHSLIDKLLYKKIEVKVEKKDPYEITGQVNVL